ncbi:hypothetical protein CALCODRAFT_443460 [Calocera cornea HHB12733]|uniref:Clavaminate synthase-like protein n=1 Tax=Calocera cornea HHB12733 TaxID=1353952 RepID=A0A165CPU4_9BASI|nr:hypothetical protein CALCODRAFT_443460 [Calocera cornea HHB12733]
MPVEYKFLKPEQREFFLKHGWLKIPNAINKKYIDAWMKDIWIRLDYKEDDPSTWKEEYVKLPRHREVLASEFAPDAWAAACDLCGGEDRLDEVRERYNGDHFILNFGSDYWKTHDCTPQETPGWHTDNDWYRQFLDSAGTALTMIHCFTDIEPRGGGTLLCEDGLTDVCKYLYDHPEGLEVPFRGHVENIANCEEFFTVTAKAGDTFLTHSLLPHTASRNHLRNLRVITNPHASLKEPFNFNRADPSDYSLVEQAILDRLGKPNGLPEWHITAPRRFFYPRNYTFKVARVQEELERMIAHAKSQGLGPESVDSIYLRGDDAIKEHQRRNGFNLPHGPNKFPDGVKTYLHDFDKNPQRAADDV